MNIRTIIINSLRIALSVLNSDQKKLAISLFLSLLQESQTQSSETVKLSTQAVDKAFLPYPPELVEFERLYDPETGGWHVPPGIITINQFNKELYPTVFYDSVEREVGHFYHAIVKMLKPTLILETGVSRGYSTTCVASALFEVGNSGHIYAIDPADYPHIWPDNLKEYITWIPKCSQDSLPDVNMNKYDLLIIDSLHDYDTCAWEVINFEPLLKVGGIILMHDSLCFDGVGAVVCQLISNPRFEVMTLNTPRTHGNPQSRCPGLTMVRKLKDGRPIVEFENKFSGWFVGDTLTVPYLENHISSINIRSNISNVSI